MAGRGEAPSSPPTRTALFSSSSVVCCMCGDYGLRPELFGCKICITRSQHKYCSDLYQKAEDYQVCNWCLRDQGRKPVATSVDSSSSTPSNNSRIGGSRMKLHRGAFSPHLSKPVKRPRLLIRSQSDVGYSEMPEELSPGTGKGRQVMRGKVRRYKLLEDVSG